MDHQGASDAALVKLLAHHGRAASRQEDLVGLWRALEDEHMGRYLAGQMSFSEQRRARVSSFFGHLGESLSPREADEVFSVYLDFYERGWRPFPDVLPALDVLGRTKKGIITNGDPGQQRAKLRAIGLAERFGVSVFSGEAGVSKPSPAIFGEACAKAGLRPSSCAYVGDRLETDARAAMNAGMVGVWLDREGRFGREGLRVPGEALLIIGSLTDLAGHFG